MQNLEMTSNDEIFPSQRLRKESNVTFAIVP